MRHDIAPHLPRKVLWDLLEGQVFAFTGGDSSSIPVDTAEELLASLLYTLSFGHTQEPDPKTRLKACQLQIYLQKERVQALFRQARCGTPFAGNAFFRQTLRELGAWLPRYDIRFFAHLPPAGIDYPLARPIREDVPGIAYAQAYLTRWLTEMRFAAAFAPADVRTLLGLWLPLWPQLCVNLCEPVFVCALGRTLLGLDPRPLLVSAEQQRALWDLLAKDSPSAMQDRLSRGTLQLCNQLEVWEEEPRRYFTSLVSDLVPRLRHGDQDGWRHIFIARAAGHNMV